MPETLTARRVVYEILHLGEANVTGNGSCGPYAVLGGVGLCEHVGDVGGGRTLSAPTCLDIGRDEALRNLLCRWVHSVAIEDGRCTHEVYWQLIASCENAAAKIAIPGRPGKHSAWFCTDELGAFAELAQLRIVAWC